MADFMKKILIVSLLVMWFSVTLKHESWAFLSRSESDSSVSKTEINNNNKPPPDSHSRIREAIREKLKGSDSHDPASNSRIREAIKEKFHRKDKDESNHESNSRIRDAIKDKFRKDDHSSNSRLTEAVKDKFRKDDSKKDEKLINPKPPPYQTQQPYVPPQQPYQPYPPPQQPYNPGGQGSYVPPPPVKGSKKSEMLKSVAKKILQFSSNKNKNSYKHNYVGGVYNDYNYRPEKYAQIRGSVCKNYLEFDGIVFGEFMCPVEGYNYDETMCCGIPNEQYCCSPREAQLESGRYGNNNPYNSNNNNYGYNNNNQYGGGGGYSNQKSSNSLVVFLAIFIPCMIFMCILLGLCMFCCFKKRIYEKVRT